jgi:hypothetical protein
MSDELHAPAVLPTPQYSMYRRLSGHYSRFARYEEVTIIFELIITKIMQLQVIHLLCQS